MSASSRTPPPTRQRLLDAAARVFAMQGLEGATTREIARQAKVNEVTLFRHFQTKEKLLGEVLRQTFDSPGTPASAPTPDTPPSRTRRRPVSTLRDDLQRFAKRYDLLLHRNILLIRTLLGEIHRHRKQEKRVLHGIFAPLKEELLAALQTAREQGAIRPEIEPVIAADLFSSMIFFDVLRRTSPFAPEYPPDTIHGGRRGYVRARHRTMSARTPAQPALYGSDPRLLGPLAARLLERGTLKWIITLAASLGAILEVIDTSITNVALPDIRGNLGATLSEAGWVSTAYACANVVNHSAVRVAGRAFRAQELFRLLARRLHAFIRAVRLVTQSGVSHRRACAARTRGRRAAGQGAGGHLRSVRPGGTRRGAGHLRVGRDRGPGAGSGPRRLAHRPHGLALDFLHQHPLRHPRRADVPDVFSRRRTRQARPHRPRRLDRHRPARARAGELSDDAGGRPAGRLVRLAVHHDHGRAGVRGHRFVRVVGITRRQASREPARAAASVHDRWQFVFRDFGHGHLRHHVRHPRFLCRITSITPRRRAVCSRCPARLPPGSR